MKESEVTWGEKWEWPVLSFFKNTFSKTTKTILSQNIIQEPLIRLYLQASPPLTNDTEGLTQSLTIQTIPSYSFEKNIFFKYIPSGFFLGKYPNY